MKRVVALVIIIPFAVFTVVFLGRCKRDVVYLKTKFDQEMSIDSLLETSARLRGYSLRDRDAGRMFGGHMKLKANPFYIFAAMFSGQSIFPAGDHDWSIVFPICAKNEPGFMNMLEDLRNPKRVFEELGPGFVPKPGDARDYNTAKNYFLGNLDVVRRVDIVFKQDCVFEYTINESDIILERISIDVPVSSSIYNKTVRGD